MDAHIASVELVQYYKSYYGTYGWNLIDFVGDE